jgi:hypothetical protein
MRPFEALPEEIARLFDGLEDREIDYVLARSQMVSDTVAAQTAGISKATFYRWPAERRAHLNELAQRLKRNTALRAVMRLSEAAERAAERIVELTENRNPNVALRAAQDVLDRTIGKPTQRQEVTGAGGSALTIRIEGVLDDDDRE